MKFGLAISPMGPWGDPQRIAELAVLAEGHGWDGVFCEEYLIRTDGQDAHDVWLTLALIAQATGRITLGTMVTPLTWRQPWTVAAQAVTLDRISGGRCVLGVGSGDSNSVESELSGITRTGGQLAEILDRRLDVIDRLWSGADGPRLNPGAGAAAADPDLGRWCDHPARAARPGSALGRLVSLSRAAGRRLGGRDGRRCQSSAGRRRRGRQAGLHHRGRRPGPRRGPGGRPALSRRGRGGRGRLVDRVRPADGAVLGGVRADQGRTTAATIENARISRDKCRGHDPAAAPRLSA